MARISKKDFRKLKESDVLGSVLFYLYKLSGNPEMLPLCEISYLLSTKDTLNFFKYFGGRTITFPTYDRFIFLLKLAALYQRHFVEKQDYELCVAELGLGSYRKDHIDKMLNDLSISIEEFGDDNV